MTLPVFFSPSLPELLIVGVITIAMFGVPIAAAIALIVVLRNRTAPAGPSERFSTSAVVEEGGRLRVDLSLGPVWSGRQVRVVVEPADRL